MLIGREGERRRLAAALDEAAQGSARNAVVLGAPGVGKSALLADLADTATGAGFRVVSGVGAESETAMAYGALIGMLHQLTEPIAEASPGVQRQLVAVLEPAAGPATDPFAVGAALLQVLARVAEQTPLLVAVDDLHWLDPASRAALVFATRRLQHDRCATVVTTRPGFLADLRGFETIELGPLTVDDAAQLVGRLVTIRPEVATELARRCEGNPLALVEIVRRLSLRQRAGFDPVGDHLPVGPASVELYRDAVCGLDAPSQLALVVAALAGPDRSIVDPAAAAAADGGAAPGWNDAETAGLVAVAPREIRFTHALARSAVIALAAPSALRRARQALAATHPDRRRAMRFQAEAAEQADLTLCGELLGVAFAVLTGGRASDAYELAVLAGRIAPDAPTAARCEVVAAQAAALAGLDHRAHVDRARSDGDDATFALACVVDAGVCAWTGDVDTLDRLEALVDSRLAATDPMAAAIVLSMCGVAYWNRLDLPALKATTARCWELAGQRIDLPHPFGVMPGLAAAVYNAYLFGARTDTELGDRCLAAIEQTGQLDFVLPCLLCHVVLGRHHEAVALGERTIALATERGAVGATAWLATGLAMAHNRLGNLDHAARWANQAVELASMLPAGTYAEAQALAELAFVAVCRGDEARYLDAAGRIRVIAEHSTVTATLSVLRYVDGLRAALAGDVIAASALLRDAPGASAEGGREFFPFAYELVEVLARAGDTEGAAAVFATFAGPDGMTDVHAGQVARCAGIVADDETCRDRFDAAIAAFTANGRRLELARTHLAYGERLRRMGLRRDARTQLDAALALFTAERCTPWIERTVAAQRAAGGRPADPVPTTRTSAEALTAQEEQVAAAVAAGHTNREIAQLLFVSPKTVETHLTRIYRKLGVRSRTELAVALLAR